MFWEQVSTLLILSGQNGNGSSLSAALQEANPLPPLSDGLREFGCGADLLNKMSLLLEIRTLQVSNRESRASFVREGIRPISWAGGSTEFAPPDAGVVARASMH